MSDTKRRLFPPSTLHKPMEMSLIHKLKLHAVTRYCYFSLLFSNNSKNIYHFVVSTDIHTHKTLKYSDLLTFTTLKRTCNRLEVYSKQDPGK